MPNKLSVPAVRSTAIQQQETFAQAADPLTYLQAVDFSAASLEQLATVTREAHKSCQSHLGVALQAALIAGKALIAAREQFTYDRNTGGFRGWVAELGVSKTVAYRYIDLAKHSEIVSQAGTLSEATALLAQHRAEQQALKAGHEPPPIIKRRMTLTLNRERNAKLEAIATDRGLEVASLVTEILDRWLSQQPDPGIIEVS
jgi:hypothetical protein